MTGVACTYVFVDCLVNAEDRDRCLQSPIQACQDPELVRSGASLLLCLSGALARGGHGMSSNCEDLILFSEHEQTTATFPHHCEKVIRDPSLDSFHGVLNSSLFVRHACSTYFFSTHPRCYGDDYCWLNAITTEGQRMSNFGQHPKVGTPTLQIL